MKLSGESWPVGKAEPPYNLNTVLITVLLAVSGWICLTVIDLKADVSTLKAQVKNIERSIK